MAASAAQLQRIKAWLAERWTPTVMVIASPEVDSLCLQANGVTFAELLRPFGRLKELNGTIGVPVRTVAEHPLRLHSWTLRFHASAAMAQPPADAADARLLKVLACAAGDASPDGADEPPDVEQEVYSTPWYDAYRSEFMRLLGFAEHETMDHPVACLLVLPSTAEGDVVAAFGELLRDAVLPPLMQAGIMEPRILKQYVLLHDERDASLAGLQSAQEKLQSAVTVFGTSCHLLPINGRAPGAAGVDPGFWAAAQQESMPGAGEPVERAPPPPGGLGAALSQANFEALSTFVRELAVRRVIPHLEGRTRVLSQQVASTRKGLKNQLKSLLWRRGGSDAAGLTAPDGGAPPAASYAASSPEGQMRQLADLALMLRDTDTALSTLRLLAADLRADKAYRHYAAAQEAVGVATLLGGGPAPDAVASLKETFYRYAQLEAGSGQDGTRYATRTAMVLGELLRALGQHGDASWAYMKAHFQESDLRAALLLEQAGLSLLRMDPPKARKCAFHLVLSGLRYAAAGQRGLARRCYRQVLRAYEGRQWDLIGEHLHDTLGKHCRDAGDLAGAVQHYMAMLLCPRNSAYCQRIYLAQFGEALEHAKAQLGQDPVLALPIPVMDLAHVRLHYDSQTCYAGAAAHEVHSSSWAVLEGAVQPPSESPLTWLDGGSRLSLADPQRRHTCCVGEAVGLEVQLSNPLRVELRIDRLRLACCFEPAAPAGEAEAAEQPEAPGYLAHEEALTLAPGSSAAVQLRVVPLRPGTLSVAGVAWTLNDAASGLQLLRIPQPRPRKPGSSRALLDAERPPPGGVSLRVVTPMPRLEVALAGLPHSLLVGQLASCSATLRNAGPVPLHGLCLAVAGGEGVVLGGAGVARAQRQGCVVFSLPAGTVLEGSQELTLPIYFRTATPGPGRFNAVWYYEPAVRGREGLAFRTLRCSYAAVALPSLAPSAHALAGMPSPGRCLLQLHAVNQQGLESFRLTSLRAVGQQWEVQPLAEAGVGPAPVLELGTQVAPEAAATQHCVLARAVAAAGGSPPGERDAEAAAALTLYEQGRPAQPSAAGPAGSDAAEQQQQQRWRLEQPGTESEFAQPVDLMLCWEAGAKPGEPPRRGFHALYQLRPRLGPPVQAQLTGPASVRHDFGAAPFCRLPLLLHLRNTLPAPAAVCIELGRAPDGSATPAGDATWAALPARPGDASPAALRRSSTLEEAPPSALPPCRGYAWAGRTRLTLPQLQPGATVRVPLEAVALVPGMQALSDYSVAWTYATLPQHAGSRLGPPCFVDVLG